MKNLLPFFEPVLIFTFFTLLLEYHLMKISKDLMLISTKGNEFRLYRIFLPNCNFLKVYCIYN